MPTMTDEMWPLEQVLAEYRDGEEHGWDTEFEWIRQHQRDYLLDLIVDIQDNGIREPILLGSDGRVWDGHHRLCVAAAIALPRVPVTIVRAE